MTAGEVSIAAFAPGRALRLMEISRIDRADFA
jgi:hypothetical protein